MQILPQTGGMCMKRLLRAVCLVLCWTLLMAGMPGKASAEEAAPMVRVLLRRLQLTDRADLTLAGDRKSTRLNSSHGAKSRMPSSA